MLAPYVAVTVVAAIAFASAAVLNFTHNKSVAETAERLGVPVSWQVPLGFLLGAGAVGLLTGFVVPALGTAAACGLVLYFLCAAGAHIRARDTRPLAWINWFGFFALAVAALIIGLVYRGPMRSVDAGLYAPADAGQSEVLDAAMGDGDRAPGSPGDRSGSGVGLQRH